MNSGRWVAGSGVGMDGFSWSDLGARPMFFPAVGFGLGAWVGGETTVPAGLFLAAAGLLALLGLCFSTHTGAHLALLGALFCAGAGLSTLQRTVVFPPDLFLQPSVRLEGDLEEVMEAPGSTRLLMAVSHLPERPEAPVRVRVVLFAQGEPHRWEVGQRLQLRTHLKPLGEAANWGEWDGSVPARRRGVAFSGSFDGARAVVLRPPSPVRQWIRRTRERLEQRAHALAPSPEAADLYLTLAAGLRSGLPPALEAAFARSGLAHVLSVSGLHVAALGLAALKLLRALWVRLPGARRVEARRVAAPLAVPLVWAYVVFTGSQPPAIRSAVMTTVLLLGHALWRRSDGLNGLALAALTVGVLDPACVADLSMQLSFLAVGSLVLLSPALRACLPFPSTLPSEVEGWRRRLLQGRELAAGTFCASLAVTLAGAPLIAASFQRLSLAGLFSNIVCLPLCAVLTLLAAGGAALFALWPPLSVPLLFVGGWASQLLLLAAQFFASMPGAALEMTALGTLRTALYALALGVFALGGRRLRPLGWVAPGLLLLHGLWPPGAVEGLEVTFLSVGHGDAVVLRSGREAALVDGGGVPGGSDTGRRFVLPFLRQSRVSRLALAVLSHPHPDHALGLASTLEQLPTARLWLSAGSAEGPLSDRVRQAAGKATVEEVERGHPPFGLGEATIDVLGPPPDRLLLEGVNDRSIVLKVTHRQVTFLLAGDLEEAGEEALLGEVGAVTVMKAPHHGSGTSSTAELLSRTRPKFVVFCVGRKNRFHFPAEEVVARYQALGSRCFRTDLDGAVRFRSDGSSVEVETFLPQRVVEDTPVAASESETHY